MKKTNSINLVMAGLIFGSLGMVNSNTAEAAVMAVDNGFAIVGHQSPTILEIVKDTASKMSVIDQTTANLKTLNTMRGGTNGFGGFVGEHLEAQAASLEGRATSVVNNNGPVDLIFKGKNGHTYNQQLKIGYEKGNIDLPKYKGQTVLVDKGNPKFNQLVKEGKEVGIKVKEAHITKAETKNVADMMQKETAITGSKTASVVPELNGLANKVAVAHKAGCTAAKSTALAGGGFSLGHNAVKVLKGEKELGEAAVDVALDTGKAAAVGYVAGAAGSAVASTAVGSAVIGAASTVATAATTAVASTTVGATAIAAGTAATAAVGAAGTAVATTAVGALATAGSAVGGAAVAATAGTAVGGAVATGVGAMAAGGAALGAAAVAAAPVVAVCAVVGGLFALFD